ncbi:MAG: DUF2177 family protein [Myxococcota bacterium]|nr:DUF2177 family protein [Myxococcota bacterium]
MNTRETTSGSSKPIGIVLSAAIASGLSFFALDLVWLGIIAQPIYAKHMGDLLTKSTVWSAALMFYVMYIGAIQVHAIWPSDNLKTAAKRGAGMGFFGYATYELTNWAVITDWPAALVPIDIVWGVILTASCAAAGFLVKDRMLRRRT